MAQVFAQAELKSCRRYILSAAMGAILSIACITPGIVNDNHGAVPQSRKADHRILTALQTYRQRPGPLPVKKSLSLFRSFAGVANSPCPWPGNHYLPTAEKLFWLTLILDCAIS